MRPPVVSADVNGWFCTNCKSLNQRGAKKCYRCGQRQDYLPLPDLMAPMTPPPGPGSPVPGNPMGPPPAMFAPGQPPGLPPAGTFAAPVTPPPSLLFDGDRPRRRKPGLAPIAIGALVLVAVIAVAASLSLGRGDGNGAQPTAPTASSSADPSGAAAASPTPAGSPSPSLPLVSPTPSVPPAAIADAVLRVVQAPTFSGHTELHVEFTIAGISGQTDGNADFSGSDVRANQRTVVPADNSSADVHLIMAGNKMFDREAGGWKRIYVRPSIMPWDVFDELRYGTELDTPTPGTGTDRGLWRIRWTGPEDQAERVFGMIAGSGTKLKSVEYVIFARADGTPVRVTVDIRSTIHRQGHNYTFNVSAGWQYSKVGSTITIEPPADDGSNQA